MGGCPTPSCSPLSYRASFWAGVTSNWIISRYGPGMLSRERVAVEGEESLLPSWDFSGTSEKELSPRVRLPCMVPKWIPWVPQEHHSAQNDLLAPFPMLPFASRIQLCYRATCGVFCWDGSFSHLLTIITGEGVTVYCHSWEKYILERTEPFPLSGRYWSVAVLTADE